MMQQAREPYDADESLRAILAGMVRSACADVLSLRRPRPKSWKSFAAAVRSLAWLAGSRAFALPATEVCRAVGIHQDELLDRLERSLGHERYVELRELASHSMGGE